jgi:hypothetical protein
MSTNTKRVTVEGLRGADVATIKVLTQDILGLPLNQIHPTTACDLFALAEVSDQVPEQLAQDLSAFVQRCGRELSDLPDGASLDDYTGGLLKMDATLVPETFRMALAALSEGADDGIKAVLDTLVSHFDGVSAAPFDVSEATSKAATAAENKGVAKKAKAKSKAAAKKQNDQERRAWIAQFALGRLVNYETGLKESLLVGAARHKAPWDDITEREVRSVLRAMGRDGKLRTTVGRWLISR